MDVIKIMMNMYIIKITNIPIFNKYYFIKIICTHYNYNLFLFIVQHIIFILYLLIIISYICKFKYYFEIMYNLYLFKVSILSNYQLIYNKKIIYTLFSIYYINKHYDLVIILKINKYINHDELQY